MLGAIAKPVWEKLDQQIRHTVTEFRKVYQLPKALEQDHGSLSQSKAN
jgi:hypothetical protein